jgi:NADPH-dependent ferric siderophore reductase
MSPVEPMYGTVVRTERMAPRMVRVVLDGDGLAGFTPTGRTDQYVNALFLPPGSPWTVPFDPDEVKAGPPEHRPRGRRETVRRWDAERGELTLELVTHGDVGLAGRWASRARPGDRLQLTGPNGGYAPDPRASGHLMVGDESALPAIAASLERVPAGVAVAAVVVVDGPDDEVPLPTAGDLTLRWVHRRHEPGGHEERVVAAVAALDLPDGWVQPFVHGEAGEVRAVRRHLRTERGLDVAGASISPYWRRGLDDEGWREVKRDWVRETEQEG